MTSSEFSNEFDVLYNNIMSNRAPGLDEYEKSVFLTKAQDEILKAYFDPSLNKSQNGFDGSERRQIDFSILVNVDKPTVTAGAGNIDTRPAGVAKVDLPKALMILNEVVKVTRGTIIGMDLQVVPIAYTEYSRLMSKPYKRPLKWQAWRLQTMEESTSKADLIANNTDTITGYEVRYLKRPNPIIVGPLEGVTIGGYMGCDENGKLVHTGATKGSECELDPILHQEILQRAVELAKAAYTGDLQSQVALGQSSQTNMGAVARQG